MKIIVESAIALDTKQLKDLETVLKKRVTGKFSVENVIHPEILGGLRVTIDSQRFDLSLSGKLEQIKKAL